MRSEIIKFRRRVYLCSSEHGWHLQVALYRAYFNYTTQDHAYYKRFPSALNASDLVRVIGVHLRPAPVEVRLDPRIQWVLLIRAAERGVRRVSPAS